MFIVMQFAGALLAVAAIRALYPDDTETGFPDARVRCRSPRAAVDRTARIGDRRPVPDEFGRWQAERVCAWLAHEPVDAVVASPKAAPLRPFSHSSICSTYRS